MKGTPPNLDESTADVEAVEIVGAEVVIGFTLGEVLGPTAVAARAFCWPTEASDPADFCIIVPNCRTLGAAPADSLATANIANIPVKILFIDIFPSFRLYVP